MTEAQTTLTVHNIALTPVEFNGQRVVTLAMIDRVHQRPEGTASRNFRENRDRFIQGKDFYLVDFSQNNEFRRFGIEVPPRELFVLSEPGYLMLVKSFTDDLAWQVQRELVENYFRAQSASNIHFLKRAFTMP